MQVGIQSLLGNPQHLANLGDGMLLFIVQSVQPLPLFFIQCLGSAAYATSSSCRTESRLCPLPDKISFKFGECSKNLEDKFSSASSHIYGFCKAPKADTSLFQLVDGFNKVLQRATQTVKPPD